MHLFKILPILASACCVAASDEGSTRKEPLRGFLEDKHLIAPEDHHSVSITSDSPKNLQKYCVETEIWWVDSNGDTVIGTMMIDPGVTRPTSGSTTTLMRRMVCISQRQQY